MCDSCQNIHGDWAPVCGNCGSFDTLSWREPPQGEIVSASGTEMLPLIVGALEDNRDEVEEEAEVIEVDAEVETVDADVVEAEAKVEK